MKDEARKDEVREIIGPHGSVSRIQAGGIRLERDGLKAFDEGVQKSTLSANGDLFIGSDISLPANTSFIAFANAQVYNNEEVGAGDVLIGDNSSGMSNLFWDASVGKLGFRQGQTVVAYLNSTASFAQVGAKVRRVADQTFTTGTPAALSFDTEDWDDASFWAVGNPTNLVIPQTGTYEITVRAAFASNATGQRMVDIYVNTVYLSRLYSVDATAGGQNTIITMPGEWTFTAGDIVEVYLYQNSGGNLVAIGNAIIKRVK